jgi:hypothetical protein
MFSEYVHALATLRGDVFRSADWYAHKSARVPGYTPTYILGVKSFVC